MDPTPSDWLTPPRIVREFAIRENKVASWISTGELIAYDLSERPGGRPRWRIRRQDLETFLLRRQSQGPVTPIRRRRRQDDDVIKFF